tara:strand:- start:259 stop:546 length:288 start_codon:yes stop_codon:yes gene_type:complete
MNRTNDVRAVQAIVDTYVKGTGARNFDLLKAVFHDNAVMCGYLGPAKLIGSLQPFYDHLQANPHSDESYTTKTTSVSVTGRTAFARLVEGNLYGM